MYGIHIGNRQPPAEVLGDGRGDERDRLHCIRGQVRPETYNNDGNVRPSVELEFGPGSPAALALWRYGNFVRTCERHRF